MPVTKSCSLMAMLSSYIISQPCFFFFGSSSISRLNFHLRAEMYELLVNKRCFLLNLILLNASMLSKCCFCLQMLPLSFAFLHQGRCNFRCVLLKAFIVRIAKILVKEFPSNGRVSFSVNKSTSQSFY